MRDRVSAQFTWDFILAISIFNGTLVKIIIKKKKKKKSMKLSVLCPKPEGESSGSPSWNFSGYRIDYR